MRTGNTYHNAKTILARWLDRTDAGPQHRRAVLAGFDRLRGELPNRDRWFDTNTVTLEGTEGLRAEAARLRLRVGTWGRSIHHDNHPWMGRWLAHDFQGR